MPSYILLLCRFSSLLLFPIFLTQILLGFLVCRQHFDTRVPFGILQFDHSISCHCMLKAALSSLSLSECVVIFQTVTSPKGGGERERQRDLRWPSVYQLLCSMGTILVRFGTSCCISLGFYVFNPLLLALLTEQPPQPNPCVMLCSEAKPQWVPHLIVGPSFDVNKDGLTSASNHHVSTSFKFNLHN